MRIAAAEPPAHRPIATPGASPGAFAQALARAAERLDANERAVEAALRRGGTDPAALLEVQATVYRHALDLELASKVVASAQEAIRRTLDSQR